MKEKKPLAKCNKMKPLWTKMIEIDKEKIQEEYKNRRYNYFLDIIFKRSK